MSARKLNSILNDMKIQYKCGGQWILNQNYAGKGYTKSATHTYNTIYGTAANIRTNWTQKGRLLIYHFQQEDPHLFRWGRMSREVEGTRHPSFDGTVKRK